MRKGIEILNAFGLSWTVGDDSRRKPELRDFSALAVSQLVSHVLVCVRENRAVQTVPDFYAHRVHCWR
jgi:hypothetical protein